MTKLFISYSHKDTEIILPVVTELDKHFDCWIDKDIAAGSKWRLEITKAISKCKAVLFFVSNNSINSDECTIELELANKQNKTIIPIILEDCNLPKQLNELQWIYLEDIYKLFNVLKNKPLTIIEIVTITNLLLLLYLAFS